MVTALTANSQKSMFQQAEFQEFGKLPLNVVGQEPAFRCQLRYEAGVVLTNDPIEKSLFRPVAFIHGRNATS